MWHFVGWTPYWNGLTSRQYFRESDAQSHLYPLPVLRTPIKLPPTTNDRPRSFICFDEQLFSSPVTPADASIRHIQGKMKLIMLTAVPPISPKITDMPGIRSAIISAEPERRSVNR